MPPAAKRPRPTPWDASSDESESDESDESDDATDALAVSLWLRSAQARMDVWPLATQPPTAAALVDDDDATWGAAARGVELKPCEDVAKGVGAFATRPIQRAATVGVYHGEQLTQREYAIRHGGVDDVAVTASERAAVVERAARLGALSGTSSAPTGGASNAGAYVLSLIPEVTAAVSKWIDGAADLDDEHISCIDAEDPRRSSWCRYINHAPAACANLLPRIDSRRALVWFEAAHDIKAGDELVFDYGREYSWGESPAGAAAGTAGPGAGGGESSGDGQPAASPQGHQAPGAAPPSQTSSTTDDVGCEPATGATRTTACDGKMAPIDAAAPAKRRRILRHFETSLVLSTSAALTGPQKEKIIARLSRAGESLMARARGDFVDVRCKHATPAERAAVDERVQGWFDAGVHDGFKALYDVLNRHGEMKLPEALALCAPPPAAT